MNFLTVILSLGFVGLTAAGSRILSLPFYENVNVVELDEPRHFVPTRFRRQVNYDSDLLIPEDDYQLFQRPSRQVRPVAVYLKPKEQAESIQLESEASGGFPRFERQSGGGGHHHDYVDYGAHTGHHGAFGWYADFPVHTDRR